VIAYYRATRDGRYEGMAVPGWAWVTLPQQKESNQIFPVESLAQGRALVDGFIDAQDALTTIEALLERLLATRSREERQAILDAHSQGWTPEAVKRDMRLLRYMLEREKQG
jgi:hypothetical protein